MVTLAAFVYYNMGRYLTKFRLDGATFEESTTGYVRIMGC